MNFEPLRYLFIFLLLWQSAYRISNAALITLIRFLRYFVQILGTAFQVQNLHTVVQNMPVTLKKLQHSLGLVSDDWMTEFVVCSKCHSIYEYKDCAITMGGRAIDSKLCRHISMPEHPQARFRGECGTPLLKKQRCKAGTKFVPRKAYPYRSIKRSITELVNSKSFVENCEQWRQRQTFFPSGYLCDVYDGSVWKKFIDNGFLKVPHSYLLCLNVDWFQPFKHTTYSCGAIYLTVQNLPRSQRYKKENVILVGVMPGPHESSLSVDSYLSPLIEELSQFWQGVLIPFQHNGVTVNLNVRLALSCVACDIPGSRKVCGFVGHNARQGCNKCFKQFQKNNFSGYDRQNWILRDNKTHREHCKELLNMRTKSSLHDIEMKYGVRYSVLLALPYFDPIAFTVIDPMHNLFLGTGKHVFKVWLELGLISSNDVAIIEQRMKSFCCPSDVGRLPINITSGFSGFTANQWHYWITIYSPVALKGILIDSHLRCWLLFVRACCILLSNCLHRSDLESADQYLMQFCRTFQDIYGSSHCTPNMHLHCHLKDCVINYGPPHAFWCFAFERFNGILGSVHTNSKSIESQMMRKFCQEQETSTIHIPSDKEFCELLPQTTKCKTTPSDLAISKLINISRCPLDEVESFSLIDIPIVKGLPPYHVKVLATEHISQLGSIYKQLYRNRQIAHFPYSYQEYGRVLLAGDLLGSMKPGQNNRSSSVIMAFWPGSGETLETIDYSRMRVGEVQYYIKHTIKVYTPDLNQQEDQPHFFAYVTWKKRHPDYNWFGISATVCTDLDELPETCCFLPVQRIGARCAFSRLPVKFNHITETVFIACPITLKYYT